MHQALYLALDQGGQSTRATVFDESGIAVARAAVPVAQTNVGDLGVEQDPEELVTSLQRASGRALQALGADASMQIAAAGLATQRSSMVCWDSRTGKALSPVLSWQDRRAAPLMTTYQDRAFLIEERTGLRLSPHYGAPKMRWCLDNLPAVQAARKGGHLVMGPLASFLAFRCVTPQLLVADPSNAGRTLLWGRKGQDWDPELLEIFGIPRETLPLCVPSHHSFGGVRAGGSLVPLTVLTGDQGAALFCQGRPRTDTIYINMGTGAFLQRLVPHHGVDRGRLLRSVAVRHGQEDITVLEGAVNGAGAALAWGAQTLPYPGLANQCDRLLAKHEARPLFLNTIGGLGSPYWHPEAVARFEGDGTPEAKGAAIIESIVFLIQENIEAICAASGPCQALVVTGGLAVSGGLCQALANMSRLIVRRPAEHEATARGLAFLAAGMPRAWPAGGDEHVFWPHDDGALHERHERWRALMPSPHG